MRLRFLLTVGAASLATAVLPAPELNGQKLSQDQALALAFPRAQRIERRTAYLDEAQLARVAEAIGLVEEEPGGVITHYVAHGEGGPLGVAYFDAHRVRTLDQVLMIVVGLGDRVLRVETVLFREPPEYQAPHGWLELFQGRALTPKLSLKGEIPNVTGATLTSRAVTIAVRRALAIHREVDPFGTAGEGWP